MAELTIPSNLAGALPFAIPSTGNYWNPDGFNVSGNRAPTQSTVEYSPMFIPYVIVIDRLAVKVNTLAAASTVRLGIYSDTGTAAPGALVLDAGTIDSTATGVKQITVSLTLPRGLYWRALVSQGGAPTMQKAAAEAAATLLGLTDATFASFVGYTEAGVTGALNGTATPVLSTFAASDPIAFALRRG